MSRFSVVYDLNDRNIGIEGEEFYAVIAAYVKKISVLAGLTVKEDKALLKAAAKAEATGDEQDKKAMMAELKKFLEGQDESVVKICTCKLSNTEKIESLNDFAVLLGAQRQMSENISKSREYAKIDDILRAEQDKYDGNKAYYKTVTALAYNEKALEAFIKKSAGSVATPMDALKAAVKQNLATEEDNFLSQQSGYVGNAVSLIVEDCSRILMHTNSESEGAIQAV